MGATKTGFSRLGQDASRLPTPALLVDLPVMEANLATMAEFFRGRPAKLRPHFKNHRVLALADQQMGAGAVGITCARIWQARGLVRHGISSVLIANEIAGEEMMRDFVDLSRAAPVIVAVDDPRVVDDLARLAGADAGLLNVVVDVDLGLNRCGVAPGDAPLRLARHVLARGLKLRGLMGYEGHLQNSPPGPEKDGLVTAAMKSLVDARKSLEKAGIPVEIVSCGGTGDFTVAGAYPGITEIQAGSYLLMGTSYVPAVPQFQVAVSVLTTVISKPERTRVVTDAGSKAISGERGMPTIKGWPLLEVRALHAEHALIDIGDAPLDVGDVLELLVHYQDGTMNLHQQMFGVRNRKLEEVFTIQHPPHADG